MTAGTGVELILQERFRQVDVEGHTAQGDAGRAGELAQAAQCYLALAGSLIAGNDDDIAAAFSQVPSGWPWGRRDWRPQIDSTRMLVIAGALTAAAIDADNAAYQSRVAALCALTDPPEPIQPTRRTF